MSATQLTWPQVLGRLIQRENLPREYSRWAMTEIMGGNASPAHMAGFFMAQHAKRENVGLVDGMVEAMYEYATPIEGYYQCGSGTHPGGCVIGSPGRLASQRILRDHARNS